MTKNDSSNYSKAIKRSCLIDNFIIKRPRLDTKDNDGNIIDDPLNHSIAKKRANLLDSSDSESPGDEYQEETDSITTEQMNIMDYFNNSTVDDLSQITGCSETKALRIIQERPFETLEQLKASKIISQKIIDGCLEILTIKQNLIELLKKCEIISANLINRIRPLLVAVDIDSPDALGTENLILDQPQYINPSLHLKSYQLIGINWLRIVHEENLNGILADEMGLGKTVQTIAFLSYLLDNGHKGPHIIIVPTSTLNNWERELYKWSPNLKVIVYYGNQEERRQMRYKISQDNSFHVLLTTYNIAVSSKEDRLFIKKLDFYYGVFDEAHMLKNMMSIRYKYLSNFKVIKEYLNVSTEFPPIFNWQIRRKLLLTGTPLQNNLVELISLLSFVMPNIFLNENEGLKKIFQMSQKSTLKQSSFNDAKIRQIKEMLTPFCLRRLKSQVLSQMPSKTTEIAILPLTEAQSTLYKQIIERTKNSQDDGLIVKSALSTVMELRKLSNHSLLVRDYYTDSILHKISRDMLLDEDHITANTDLIFEDLSYMHDFEIHKNCLRYPHAVGKYKLPQELLLKSNKIQYLDENLPILIENGDKILIFSQFIMVLDIIEEFLKYKHISYLRLDGSTSTDDRQDYIDQFNEDDDIKVFILTTRAGGLGINLTSANVVIIFDIDYNPYNDRQAEDRSHRLGQLRDVKVIKLISKGTIDECILKIANEKLKLEQITMTYDDIDNDDESKSSSSEPKDVDFGSLLKQAMDI